MNCTCIAIIDFQLPFEYTIASRSTDVIVLCQLDGITCSKLDQFGFQKLNVLEQPMTPAPAPNAPDKGLEACNAQYDRHNDVACLMLNNISPKLQRQFENYSPYDMLQELESMFKKQTGVERFDLIQTFHACKQKEGQFISSYILKMRSYLEQLERLGYILPQDINVGLILNGLSNDLARFVRNYNMRNMGKTIGALHAMLIEYEKGLPKKAATP
ncbi:hypothetical protein Tco_1428505 [Tanacetum coccineum]